MSTSSSPLVQRLRGVPGGVTLMLLGAALAAAGLLQTTSSHYNVTSTCVAPSVLVAKYVGVNGSYVFDSPAGNGSIVTITKAKKSGGNWTSTRAISSLIVKGGPNNVLVSLSPPQTSGVFSNSWLPKVKGSAPDVADVQFCGSNSATTTTVPSTTSTAKPASSTTQAQVTTTAPATTTTTDQYSTTTTEPAVTTTAPRVTTTTAPAATTTTAKPATTTTEKTTTTVTPTKPAPTTTADQYSTTTEAAGPTTTTAKPSATTTTDPSTTTVAGATTTTGRATTTTVVDVEGSQITAPVTTSTSIVAVSDETSSNLPFTGSSSGPLVVIGLALLLGGGAVTLVAARRGRAGAGTV